MHTALFRSEESFAPEGAGSRMKSLGGPHLLFLRASRVRTPANFAAPSNVTKCTEILLWRLHYMREAPHPANLPLAVRVQVLNTHVLTQTLYYNYYYPNPRYLIIRYLDPLGSPSFEAFPRSLNPKPYLDPKSR